MLPQKGFPCLNYKKARKLYRMFKNRLGYKQTGRAENVFGSLTDAYGDKLKVMNTIAMKVRIASRVLSYQLRLLIRIKEKLFELLDTSLIN